ncbi:MAG: hypothetical protein O2819_06880 [Planctomycetota bacterium]|nr:hypothetical protein [Planctomycetota bacterium]MDA1105180.1 hypothetical protein [Planctomycetota bacterium]
MIARSTSWLSGAAAAPALALVAGLAAQACSCAAQDPTPATPPPAAAPGTAVTPSQARTAVDTTADSALAAAEEPSFRSVKPTPRELPSEMPPDVRALLQRAWDEVGGPDPLAQYKSLQFTMTTLGSNVHATITVKFAPGPRLLLRQFLPDQGVALEKGFDGRLAWAYKPDSKSWEVVDPNDVLRHGILWDTPNVFSRALTMPGLAWEIREPEAFAGTPCHVVRIWKSGGKWVELMIGQANFIPVGTRTFNPALDRVDQSSQWLELMRVGGDQGFLVPMRSVTQTDMGQNEMVFSEVAVDTLTPQDFEPPQVILEMAAAMERERMMRQREAARVAPPSAPPRQAPPGGTTVP